MNNQEIESKRIGQRLAVKSGLIGLLIAYLIMTLLHSGETFINALTWITQDNYQINMIVGACGLVLASYFFGQRAGIEIIIKKRNPGWTGIKYGLLTLWVGTIIGSSIGFVQEGLDAFRPSYDEPFFDYFYKPWFWVTFFGLIPVIVVGLWFGRQIKTQGQKIA